MLEVSKKPIRKERSHQSPSKNDLILPSKTEKNYANSTKKDISNIIDFIKQKNRFILQNSFDIKGTREFLASKEVAMRVIKLNDEIIEEDKKNNEDFVIKGINNSNIGNDMTKNKHNLKNKISGVPVKAKFKSNKEIFYDIDFKKFKKELKNTKENLNSKGTNGKLIHKKKSKHKKTIKSHIESPGKNRNFYSSKKEFGRNLLSVYASPKKIHSSNILPQKHIQSQFLFSEINKKLMADDELNLSGIDENNDRNLTCKHNIKEIYYSDINNDSKFKNKLKNKIAKDMFEDDKSQSKNQDIICPNNSDKESLLSILSDLM
jgi:hypothetical protein